MPLVDLPTPTAPSPNNDHANAVIENERTKNLPVAIIGAGPVGLAAAVNLLERGIDFVIFEAGETVAANIRRWGHTRLFSPWTTLIDPASRRLLEATGWTPPPSDRVPDGNELIDKYLHPLASLEQIASRIRTGVDVLAVSREGMDRTRTAGRERAPFVLRARDRSGKIADVLARAVIDASGTYRNPNSVGSNGLEPLGFPDVSDLLLPALPDVLGRDRSRFAGRHTTVVGAGHSAANTLLSLAALARDEPGTQITWLIRNPSAERVSSSADDELPARASVGQRVADLAASGDIDVLDRFEIVDVAPSGSDDPGDGDIRITGIHHGEFMEHDTDIIVNATGFRPNLDMLREIRLDLDDVVEAPRQLAPLIDPNVHSCGTVAPHGFAELKHPEVGFFVVGMKSYGRAPTFLLATGYEQVRSVVAWLDGDLVSANAVHLVLPATGACSTTLGGAPDVDSDVAGTCC